MKRRITQTQSFAKAIDDFVRKRRLREWDFEEFKQKLAEDPHAGDIIPGTGGIRKIRVKSASRGKSGGFRVGYYYDEHEEEIFLIVIYPKNEQTNLTADEKKALKKLTKILKKARPNHE